jgi:hypothetical protein
MTGWLVTAVEAIFFLVHIQTYGMRERRTFYGSFKC